MQPILYLIQKEFRQIFRDKPMLFIIFFAPLVQMTILGFAITIDITNVSTVIVDHDKSPISREIARAFEHNSYFVVKGYVDGESEIRKRIDAWEAQIAIVIPNDFARDLNLGLRPEIQVILDAVDGNTAGIAFGYVRGVLANFTVDIIQSNPHLAAQMREASVTDPQTRMWYNLDLESKNYMVPGLIAVLLTLVSMFLSSMGLVREKEIGTLEQLMVTPIKTWQLILGKVLPFLILGFVALAIMLVVAFVVFQLSLAGSIVLLFALSTLYLLSTLGLGIFISTLAQTQQQAMFISWFFMIFLIFMSGFLFPIENMPAVVQKITYADPMRYFVIILREIFLKGSSAKFLVNEILSLTGMGLIILGLSTLKFQKRVS
ncbi:ABC transporter permease [candidate division KSB1 bacterium]|nr:ABC transporter permease [candidate division KSB1 bacterium]NIR68640.1 ABC transporter permease [candidate division KSB1 bacterium]NIS27129.1 ABC transporter permease [candidate division KSB1 bacterium]NIT74015.1 ABC transporter permease [candidate division KSB1 bacterium]NIU27881.1 ABC transporter permease [candidate division KSB1 bacterium]